MGKESPIHTHIIAIINVMIANNALHLCRAQPFGLYFNFDYFY